MAQNTAQAAPAKPTRRWLVWAGAVAFVALILVAWFNTRSRKLGTPPIGVNFYRTLDGHRWAALNRHLRPDEMLEVKTVTGGGKTESFSVHAPDAAGPASEVALGPSLGAQFQTGDTIEVTYLHLRKGPFASLMGWKDEYERLVVTCPPDDQLQVRAFLNQTVPGPR